MKNRTLCIVSSMMLALSVICTTCSVNATAYPANAKEATFDFPRGADSVTLEEKEAIMRGKKIAPTTEQKIAIIKKCFRRENIYGDDIYLISVEQLFDFLNGKIHEKDRDYFERLKTLMDEACRLEWCDCDDANEDSICLARKIWGLYNKSTLFSFEEERDVISWENALWEMVQNPLGAKRMLSLLLLRRIGSSSVKSSAADHFGDSSVKSGAADHFGDSSVKSGAADHFAYKFNHAILVKRPAPGTDGKRSKEEEAGSAFYPDGKFVFVPQSSQEHPVASTIMHEFTHFYHHLLFGRMPRDRTLMVNMASDNDFCLTNTLFPTKNLGTGYTFGDFSCEMLKAIGGKTVDKASLNNLLNKLKTTGDEHILPITETKYDMYKNRLNAATTPDSLRRIAADLIAEYAFSSNYWTDAEEILTIFGLARIGKDGDKRVVVVDSGHETSFRRSSEKSRALSSSGDMDAIRFWHCSTLFARVASNNTDADIWNILQGFGIIEAYNKTIDEYQGRARKKVLQMCQTGRVFGGYHYSPVSLPQRQLGLLPSAYGFAQAENSNNRDVIKRYFALNSTDVDDVPAEKLFECVKNDFLSWKEYVLDDCALGSYSEYFEESCKNFVALSNLMDEVCNLERSSSYSSKIVDDIMVFYRNNDKFRVLFELDDISANGKLLFEDALRKMIENPSGAKTLLSLLLLRNIVEDVKYVHEHGMTGCKAANHCTGNYFAYKFDHHILVTMAASEEKSISSPEGYISLPLHQKRTGENIRRLSGILMRELTSFYRFILLGTMPEQ